MAIVDFEYDGQSDLSGKWQGLVDFQGCPDGEFKEAVNGFGDVLYVFQLTDQEVFAPVLEAAREHRAKTA